MNKAKLLCASIGWQTRYDEKGRPQAKQVAVSVSWIPYEMSYKRCVCNHRISDVDASLMRHKPQQIEMMADYIARYFASADAKLMEQYHAEPSDISEACEELRRVLPDGFRAFLENDKIWIYHFNDVLNVPKGNRYRAEDGEWYEAEEDMMIAVHCGAGEQMMTQEEFTKIQGYDTERA